MNYIFQLLRLNHTSLGETSAGYLVNLMSNDVQRFDTSLQFLNYLWIMPIQAVFGAYIMFNSVGIATIAGMVVLTIQAIPVQGMYLDY